MNATARELRAPSRPSIGAFERRLTWWVLACMAVGVLLGRSFPGVFAEVSRVEIARVNLPVAALVWLMIVPMLLKIDFRSLGAVRRHWRGVAVTLAVNWAIKPFSMALLAALFVGYLFTSWLPAGQAPSYSAGLVLLAAAPCTAMVFVWSNLCAGDAHFTLSQVALNDAIMVFAFAPLVAALLGVASIVVPWATLLLSVLLYIVVPVAVAQALRGRALRQSADTLSRWLAVLQPVSIGALLLTLVLLFGFQGDAIVRQPLVIALLAVPILIQVYLNAGIAYVASRALGVEWRVAAPSALIGASNFFELAVATAIALFGIDSGAALATVVGVLVEVPVMLSVVALVRRTRPWYERHAEAINAP